VICSLVVPLQQRWQISEITSIHFDNPPSFVLFINVFFHVWTTANINNVVACNEAVLGTLRGEIARMTTLGPELAKSCKVSACFDSGTLN